MITPPKPLIGSSGQAVWLERLRRSTESQRASFGDGVLVSKTSRGVSYRSSKRKGGGGGTTILPMQVVQIFDNYYVCNVLSGGVAESGDIQVARPWLHRRYVWDKTQNTTSGLYTYVNAQKRTIIDGVYTVTHEIIAPVATGDMIIAANVFTTGGLSSTEWLWADLNWDGRDWARTKSELTNP